MRALVPALLALALVAPRTLAQDGPPAPSIPDGLHGFAGELVGTVVRTWEGAFTLRVDEVGRVWKHSQAAAPGSAVGQTLLVNLRWERAGADGPYRLVPAHAEWLRRCVQPGQRLRVDVKNDELARLHLMELEADQRQALAAARGDAPAAGAPASQPAPLPEPGLPDGLRGFAGTLEGTVVRTGGAALLLCVERVEPAAASKAPAPAAAVWRVVRIDPRWEQGEGGRWRPAPAHAGYVATLTPGQRVTLEVVNDEAARLHLVR
jgi:hypothetical protein